jgi:universal stress protein E
MNTWRNILFVSQGLTDEAATLKQALSVARNNQAALKILVVCPELPQALANYRDSFVASLVDHVKSSLKSANNSVNPSEADVAVEFKLEGSNLHSAKFGDITVKIEAESGATPANIMIRHVLKNKHDLLIKEAEPKEGGRGFMAVDMELLRKCPCPVWLSRPISKHRNEIKVAVAVDPESLFPEGEALSLRLLQLGRSYADTCSGELDIVSCWDFMSERSFRHNPWIKVKEEEVTQMVEEVRTRSRSALDGLVKNAKVSGKVLVNHLRGNPSKKIPGYIRDNNIDILIMGTVGRTGISGFFIGNTAENIMQELSCSMLALKPNGFVSPVTLGS